MKAVDGISYDIQEGETVGLVGESGCGKSVSALSLLRLVQDPPGRIVGGTVEFEGRDLLALSNAEMREVRGNDIAMVFQEPMSSLNPVLTVGRQITEALEVHLRLPKREADSRAAELLHMVGIPDAADRLKTYPHQFSGGMRQRVMIAMALSCNPRLVIADEPTTALDVTIQAQILELLQRLSAEMGTAVLIITHNLGVIARYASRVNVMYAARSSRAARRRRSSATLSTRTRGVCCSLCRASTRAAARSSPPSKGRRRTSRTSPLAAHFTPAAPTPSTSAASRRQP